MDNPGGFGLRAPATGTTNAGNVNFYVYPDISAPIQATLGHTLNTVAEEKDITVTNNGATQTLNISGAPFSGSGAAKFSVVSGVPAALAPGASATIRVRFTPGSVNGLFKANLDIASDDPSNASTPVTVTAFSNPGPTVLINEFDTENSSAEYLEQINTMSSSIDLGTDGFVLVFINGSDNRVYQATGLTETIPARGFFLLTESGVSGAWQADGIIYGGTDVKVDSELGLSGVNIAVQASMASMRVTDGQGGPNDSYANSDWTTGIGTPADRYAPLAARCWTLYE